MNISLLDWGIIAVLALALIAMLIYTQKYVKSTADFLAAGRCGGRYLLTIAAGVAGMGAVNIIAIFEMNYQAGFAPVWWGFFIGLVYLGMGLTGWVVYRFRETRSLTMPQFFEVRYGRGFRIFAGILAWTSGVLNYGIFPAVSVRFFMFYCGIPRYIELSAYGRIDLFLLLLVLVLALGASFAILGGQISIMVTDFMQGMFCNAVFLVLLVFLAWLIPWNLVEEVLIQLSTPGESLVNPFDTGGIRDFNPWFFLINLVSIFYMTNVWLGSQGYMVSAKSPHESRMAGLLSGWRSMAQGTLFLVIPIVALIVMKGGIPQFQEVADSAAGALTAAGSESQYNQLVVPVVLQKLLPLGLTGLFAAMMFAAMLSTDNTYMMSWGSILIQDVILPLRGNRPLKPKTHILLLRLSIVLVAVIALLVSYFYQQTQNIFFYFNITGAIYVGGAGVVVIGGLYWKRSTREGAWAAMITGSLLSISNLVLCNRLPEWFQNAEGGPLVNEQWGYAFSMAGAVGVFIAVSLATGTKPFNLDRMLHRGRYAVAGEHARPSTGWRTFLPGVEFTFGDKVIFWLGVVYTLGWTLAGGVGMGILEACGVLTPRDWLTFWKIFLVVGLGGSVVTTVWFLIGGTRDIVYLFRALRRAVPNDADDGRVIDGRNAGD